MRFGILRRDKDRRRSHHVNDRQRTSHSTIAHYLVKTIRKLETRIHGALVCTSSPKQSVKPQPSESTVRPRSPRHFLHITERYRAPLRFRLINRHQVLISIWLLRLNSQLVIIASTSLAAKSVERDSRRWPRP